MDTPMAVWGIDPGGRPSWLSIHPFGFPEPSTSADLPVTSGFVAVFAPSSPRITIDFEERTQDDLQQRMADRPAPAGLGEGLSPDRRAQHRVPSWAVEHPLLSSGESGTAREPTCTVRDGSMAPGGPRRPHRDVRADNATIAAGSQARSGNV
jgi:hypothetical protein